MRILVILAVAFLVVWGALFIVLHTVYHLYRIPTGAMEPTIHNGDHIIARRVHDIERGEIVVFKYPLEQKTMFMKRVIGVPGDTIEIKAKHVLANGHELVEPYAVHDDEVTYPSDAHLPEPYRSRDNFGPVKIPPNEYFVMGDNRDKSSDSRYWGNVPRELITGEAMWDIGRDGFRKLHQ